MTHSEESLRVVGIIQARMASSRLPGKVLAELDGVPLLQFLVERMRQAKTLDDIYVATSDSAADDPVADLCGQIGVACFRGDEHDVLRRFRDTAEVAKADAIVRITADCPLADPDVIDLAVARFRVGGFDYLSNVVQRTFPDGIDVEVFSRETLERTHREAKLPALREHLTVYMRTGVFPHLPSGQFRIEHLTNATDFSHLRWTVDHPIDLTFVRAVASRLGRHFRWMDVVALLTRDAELLQYNRRHRKRRPAVAADEPVPPRTFDKSNETFSRALRTVPLASQTFSKSHMQWVRGAAPLFVEKGDGCRVTDVDGNRYIDYVLGLLPVVLGYGDADVDAAIVAQLEKGIVFPLAHPLEVDLSEQLVRLIPCAEMVRFGKNGSDVTTAAIRLARAHTGREKLAICGYHGWHDWYIGTTTRRLGVPKSVQALSQTFPYNDADAVEDMFRKEPDAYAALILEAGGSQVPVPGFLERLRELTAQYGVVLVFDEIITGFRMHMGGAQAHYGVTPDLACFGKAMANGMPISALVGLAPIMKRMEDIFFSTTFGGEVLSIAAAMATINKLERENVISRLWERGERLRDAANATLRQRGLGELVSFGGEGWWPRIKFGKLPVDTNLMVSLLRQEFCANGLLLGASFNLCLAHDDDAVMAETVTAIDTAAGAVRDALDSGDPQARLRGEMFQPTFAVR